VKLVVICYLVDLSMRYNVDYLLIIVEISNHAVDHHRVVGDRDIILNGCVIHRPSRFLFFDFSYQTLRRLIVSDLCDLVQQKVTQPQ